MDHQEVCPHHVTWPRFSYLWSFTRGPGYLDFFLDLILIVLLLEAAIIILFMKCCSRSKPRVKPVGSSVYGVEPVGSSSSDLKLFQSRSGKVTVDKAIQTNFDVIKVNNHLHINSEYKESETYMIGTQPCVSKSEVTDQDFSNKNFISSNLKNAKREQAALAKICDEDADDEEDAKIEVRQGASEHRDPDVKHVFYTSMDRSLVDPESDQLKMEAAEGNLYFKERKNIDVNKKQSSVSRSKAIKGGLKNVKREGITAAKICYQNDKEEEIDGKGDRRREALSHPNPDANLAFLKEKDKSQMDPQTKQPMLETEDGNSCHNISSTDVVEEQVYVSRSRIIDQDLKNARRKTAAVKKICDDDDDGYDDDEKMERRQRVLLHRNPNTNLSFLKFKNRSQVDPKTQQMMLETGEGFHASADRLFTTSVVRSSELAGNSHHKISGVDIDGELSSVSRLKVVDQDLKNIRKEKNRNQSRIPKPKVITQDLKSIKNKEDDEGKILVDDNDEDEKHEKIKSRREASLHRDPDAKLSFLKFKERSPVGLEMEQPMLETGEESYHKKSSDSEVDEEQSPVSRSKIINQNVKSVRREKAAARKMYDEEEEKEKRIETRQRASLDHDSDANIAFLKFKDRSPVDPNTEQPTLETGKENHSFREYKEIYLDGNLSSMSRSEVIKQDLKNITREDVAKVMTCDKDDDGKEYLKIDSRQKASLHHEPDANLAFLKFINRIRGDPETDQPVLKTKEGSSHHKIRESVVDGEESWVARSKVISNNVQNVRREEVVSANIPDRDEEEEEEIEDGIINRRQGKPLPCSPNSNIAFLQVKDRSGVDQKTEQRMLKTKEEFDLTGSHSFTTSTPVSSNLAGKHCHKINLTEFGGKQSCVSRSKVIDQDLKNVKREEIVVAKIRDKDVDEKDGGMEWRREVSLRGDPDGDPAFFRFKDRSGIDKETKPSMLPSMLETREGTTSYREYKEIYLDGNQTSISRSKVINQDLKNFERDEVAVAKSRNESDNSKKEDGMTEKMRGASLHCNPEASLAFLKFMDKSRVDLETEQSMLETGKNTRFREYKEIYLDKNQSRVSKSKVINQDLTTIKKEKFTEEKICDRDDTDDKENKRIEMWQESSLHRNLDVNLASLKLKDRSLETEQLKLEAGEVNDSIVDRSFAAKYASDVSSVNTPIARIHETIVIERQRGRKSRDDIYFKSGWGRSVKLMDLVRARLIEESRIEQLERNEVNEEEIERELRPFLIGRYPIAGVYDDTKGRRMTLFDAHTNHLITRGTALSLLEAQAAIGGIVDPFRGEIMSVDDALLRHLLDKKFADLLKRAERAVFGFKPKGSDKVLSLFQAMEKDLIIRSHGIRLLEAQIATGGIIDPVANHRLPVEVAFERGLFDENLHKILEDSGDDTKGFLDPNTNENLTYLSLMERCVKDPETGFLLVPIVRLEDRKQYRRKRHEVTSSIQSRFSPSSSFH